MPSLLMLSCILSKPKGERLVAVITKQQSTRVLVQGIRRLVNAAYAARGGAERMSLDQWREVEQELCKDLKRNTKNISQT